MDSSMWFKLLPFIPSVMRVIDSIRFRTIFIIAFFAFLSVVLYTSWCERDVIVMQIISYAQPTTTNPKWKVSDDTVTMVKKEVDEHSLVTWVSIHEFDLGANLKTLKHWYDEDPELSRQLEYKINTTSKNQIFDFDPIHTTQMVSILQNEFICAPFAETQLAKVIPELSQQTKLVCRIAIPPFYGRFVGILSIGIKADSITDAERFEIKSMAANISTTIYWRDVVKIPK